MSEYYKEPHRYDDIINLPHHQSKSRPHMSLHDRAAQFAPFAALTGHEEAIEETARLTEEQLTLDEGEISRINEQLFEISQHLSEKWQVVITYFQPDAKKDGGSYLTDTGTVKKIDDVEHLVWMDSGMKIPMERIVSVYCKETGQFI